MTRPETGTGSRSVPLTVRVDARHGGRFTSLRGGDREWLWHRDEPRRASVRPGDPFADAGGLEECIPTVRGTPDHGDAWSRPWTGTTGVTGESAESGPDQPTLHHLAQCPEFELSRTVEVRQGAVVVRYRLVAEPGFRFVWAGHALLELSDEARLGLAGNPRVRIFPEAAPHLGRSWPDGAAWIEDDWPAPAGLPLDVFGPEDGSAIGAVAYHAGDEAARASAVVVDGHDRLHVAVEAEGQPTAIALWRNLGGYPADQPYRSIGVEPMLGRVFDLDEAGEGDCAVTPRSGVVTWQLAFAASRH